MIPLDNAVIARLTSHGHHFEILIDPDGAAEAKHNPDLDLMEVVAADEIYKDSKKGEKAAEETLKEVFQTTDFNTVARKILEKGEIQLTTEQKHKMQEQRKKQVITLILRDAIDPRTNAPIPMTRIQNAMLEAKIHINPFKSAQRQVDEVVKKLRPVLPIKFAVARVVIRIPSEYAAKTYGFLHDLNKLKEEWASDGSLTVLIEIPAGLQSDIYDKLNELTHGNVETKLVETV